MSSFTKRAIQSAKLGALAFLLAFAVAPLALAANDVGWALIDQPAQTNEYTLDSAHSFSSARAPVFVVPSGNGAYSVYFEKLGGSSAIPANVQVTANNSPNQCIPTPPMISGSSAYVLVECRNRLGALTNTEFSLLYQARSAPFGSVGNALAFLQQNTSAEQTGVSNSFNSIGGQNNASKSVTKGIGAGNYTVTLGGLSHLGGDVQVSGFEGGTTGGSGTAQCKVVDWSANTSRGTVITVQCYAVSNGQPAYSQFDLAYAIGEPFGLIPGDATLGAWLWANDLTSTTPYRPNPHFQYNGFKTGAMTAQKISTGHYTVTIPGTLTYISSIALVTAYGPGNDYCNVAGWTGGTINVICYNHNQAFADSRFNLTFQTAR